MEELYTVITEYMIPVDKLQFTDPTRQSTLQVSDSSFIRFSMTGNETKALQNSIRAADKEVLFHYISTLVSSR